MDAMNGYKRLSAPKLMGERTVGAARLKLSMPQVARSDVAFKNLRELSQLEVPSTEQRKGYATTLVHSVCREADQHGIVLMLAPQPFGDNIAMSMSELRDWYANEFGFMEFQSQPLLMARLPGSTPGKMQLRPLSASMYRAIKGK
jgi:hypothetical protein